MFGWPPTTGRKRLGKKGRRAATAAPMLPTRGALSKVEQHL